jgi:FKBP-type peptidyl-prolyl cis-trans isomerase
MKFTSKVTAALASLGLLVAASAQDPVKFNVPGVASQPATTSSAAPVAAPAVAKAKYTEAQVAEAYGWYMAGQLGLRQLEFTKDQVEAMARGMQGAISGGQPSFDAKEIGPELEAFLGKKQEAFMTKLRYQQMAEGAAFFTKLKENKNVVELPSGLRYEIVKAGTGAMPKPGQLVSIHYTGTLVNGQTFDSSIERGQPVDILLQAASAQSPNGVIPGMFEGLQKVGVGGKLKLYIPPSLAYGDAGSQVIPPGATLVFEVEVLGAKEAPPAPAAK